MIPYYEVQEFLKIVQKELKEKEVQETVILELYHHIKDSAFYNMENGLKEEEAWHVALEFMGNPSLVGKELNHSHQKRKSFLIAILGNLRTLRPYGISHHFQRNQFLYLIYGGFLLLFFIKLGSFLFKHVKGMVQIMVFLGE